jgi:hypothetical protein
MGRRCDAVVAVSPTVGRDLHRRERVRFVDDTVACYAGVLARRARSTRPAR